MLDSIPKKINGSTQVVSDNSQWVLYGIPLYMTRAGVTPTVTTSGATANIQNKIIMRYNVFEIVRLE